VTIVIERAEIESFRTLVARRLGLSFEDGKLDYLADILRSRVEAEGQGHGGRYLGRLSGAAGWRDEWRVLAEQLTVAETYFFRYWDHFRAFTEVILPEGAGPNGRSRDLRILSAGCASGEEVYSLAILIREQHPAPNDAGIVSIVGVDVNPVMILKASRARYSAWSLRETPPDLRQRHFRVEGRDFVLNEGVRSTARFEERNLIEPDPAFWRPNAFDVVFCRNVTMYFAPEVIRSVMERIRESLTPGGYLFLGHAETLRGVSEGFHLKHTHDTFYYQLRASQKSRRSAISPAIEALDAARDVPAPGPLDSGASWFEMIQRASNRIRDLANSSGTPTPIEEESSARREPLTQASTGANRAWDLGVVRDLLNQERFSDAMALMNALPADSSKDPDAQLLRAVLLTNGGDLSGAKEACMRILDVDELNAGAHYLLALCLEHEGNREKATEHDQSAAYLDPAFALPRLHLGLLAKRRGALDVAMRELGQALILLAREDSSRILLFGGGFSRDALVELCRREIRTCGGVA